MIVKHYKLPKLLEFVTTATPWPLSCQIVHAGRDSKTERPAVAPQARFSRSRVVLLINATYLVYSSLLQSFLASKIVVLMRRPIPPETHIASAVQRLSYLFHADCLCQSIFATHLLNRLSRIFPGLLPKVHSICRLSLTTLRLQ